MTYLVIIMVCTAIVVIGMVYLKIQNATVEQLQKEKKSLEWQLDDIKNQNLALEKGRIEVEQDIEKLYEKAERVALTSTTDDPASLIREFKSRKIKRRH